MCPGWGSEFISWLRELLFTNVTRSPGEIVTDLGLTPDDVMVIVVSRTDTRTEYAVEVTGELDAVIVMNDAYFPGWTAEIDGEAAPLYRADVMFRAVVVPPGRHTVIVEYRPPWLQPLLAFGAAAWVLFGLAWLAVRRLKPN